MDAKAEVWKLIPTIGILIHLLALAPEIIVPWDEVYISKRITIGSIRIEIPLKYLNGILWIENINKKPILNIIKCLKK